MNVEIAALPTITRNDIWNYLELMNRAPYVIPALFYVIPAKAGIYPCRGVLQYAPTYGFRIKCGMTKTIFFL